MRKQYHIAKLFHQVTNMRTNGHQNFFAFTVHKEHINPLYKSEKENAAKNHIVVQLGISAEPITCS